MANKTMTKKEETQITTQIEVPDNYHLDFEQDDIKTPSILLYQKMSDMIEFEDANVKAGDFVYPVTGEILGKEFEACIVRPFVTARVFGEPDESGRKTTIKFSRDGKFWDTGERIQPSEFAWKEDGSHALKSYHYLVVVKGSDMPAMVTFRGASAKFAKTLNANLMYMKPSWRTWFKFSSAVEEKGGNKYHVIQSKAQPQDTIDPETAVLALNLYESMVKGATVSSSDMDKEDFDGDSVSFE